MQQTLSIVLPLHNEEGNVNRLVDTVGNILAEQSFLAEFILVDDGSTDGTWNIMKELASRNTLIKCIRLSRNFGKEAALAAGLDIASGVAVITMDSDFQHPPELIREMIKYWKEEGYDVVEAYKEDRGGEGLLYKACSKLYYKCMDKLSGFRFDGASDFKLLDSKVLKAWKQLEERNLFFRGLCSWLGFHHKELPFKVRDRESGTSAWSTMALIRLAMTGITSFSRIPLYAFAVLGFMFLIFSMLMSVRALILKFQGVVIDGFTTLLLVNLFTGSIVITGIGVLGLYIGRIYKEVKRRPRYIIQTIINHEE